MERHRHPVLPVLFACALLGSALTTSATAKSGGRRLICPSPTRGVYKHDIRDGVCASVLTGRVVRSKSTPSAPSASDSGSLSLTQPKLSDPGDTLALANPTGTTVLLFPTNSLYMNFPGQDSFDPSLPIGILVRNAEGAAAISARTLVPGRGQVPRLSTSGLSQTGSACDQLSSNTDNSNTTSAAFYAVCYRYYKPVNGDSSATYKWRQMFSTGSAHGGNFNHQLHTTYNRTTVLDSGNLDDWDPAGGWNVGNCVTKTVTLGADGAGFTASASEGVTFCSDYFGVQYLDLPTDKFNYGWNGDLGCGGGGCFYIENAGGYNAKIPEADTWQHTEVMGIAWGL